MIRNLKIILAAGYPLGRPDNAVIAGKKVVIDDGGYVTAEDIVDIGGGLPRLGQREFDTSGGVEWVGVGGNDF